MDALPLPMMSVTNNHDIHQTTIWLTPHLIPLLTTAQKKTNQYLNNKKISYVNEHCFKVLNFRNADLKELSH